MLMLAELIFVLYNSMITYKIYYLILLNTLIYTEKPSKTIVNFTET